MCGEFGEVTVIIGLVINFLAFVPPFVSFRDTLSYIYLDTCDYDAHMYDAFFHDACIHDVMHVCIHDA